jgi:tripartite-type tricarboxylate transporter receptor subunit TctC
MKMNRRKFGGAAAAIGLTMIQPSAVRAQSALANLRIVVGYPAGGTNDAIARQLGEGLRPGYARATLVDNRPGAAGRLALAELNRSLPDGSTMVVLPESGLTLVPHVDPKPGTFAPSDLAPVSPCAVLRMGFAVGPLVPATVTTLPQFLAWAKANPTLANYGTPGPNTPQRFLTQELSQETGVPLNHIPYKGSMPGVADLIGGQVAAFFSPIGDALAHTKDGRLRLLALASAKRSALAPEIPTFAEQGFADKIGDELSGAVMAKGTPAAVLESAAKAIAQIVAQPHTVQALARLGMEPFTATPVEFARMLRDNHKRWGERIAASGFKAEI